MVGFQIEGERNKVKCLHILNNDEYIT